MTNIPKKLEPTLETGMVDLGNKINEIIDCLESKQTTNVCDCSKKDINKSKGKCEHDKDLLCERCFNPNPQEYKEWVYGFEDGTIVDLNRINGKELADLLDTRFVSKEKVKREIEENTIYVNPSVIDKPGLLESLGLGD